MTRWSTTARVGIGLVLMGILWSSALDLWKRTLIWTPLEARFSMARGRVRLPFKVKIDSTYEVQLIIGREILEMDPPCDFTRPCTGRFASLPLIWAVFKGDQEVERGSYSGSEYDEIWRRLGRFQASAGDYVLELEMPEDGSQYDRAPPWIVVDGTGDERYARTQELIERQFHFALLLIVAGVYTIIREWSILRYQRRKQFDADNRLTERGPLSGLADATDGAVARRRSFASLAPDLKKIRPPVMGFLTGFSLLTTFFLLLMVVIMMTLTAAVKLTPHGLPVRLAPFMGVRQAGLQPILVELLSRNERLRPQLYVDSQTVEWDQLGTVIREDIASRPPEWPVYLLGDPEMQAGWAGAAIDVIEGVPAHVVLLTHQRVRDPIGKR